MDKHLHLVSLDIPWPANYGGVIDIFHKLRWLHKTGWSVSLHCFEYGRAHADVLQAYASEVHYYPRHLNLRRLFGRLPFIVSSRDHKELAARLQADRSAILLEGLHCTFFLPELSMDADRRIIVRAHNIEHDYYHFLSHTERKKFHRIYLKQEAEKLERYEVVLRNASAIAAISQKDQNYFSSHYGNSFLLRPFHAFDEVKIRSGRGSFCLYHGNLAVAENESMARWLIEEVQPLCGARFVIAGQKPGRELLRLAALNKHVELVVNPDFETLDRLVEEAQVHVLPAAQESGMKLKLLHSLYRGRYIIGNQKMLNDPLLDGHCILAENANEFASAIENCIALEFTESDIRKREHLLTGYFSNEKQAILLDSQLSA